VNEWNRYDITLWLKKLFMNKQNVQQGEPAEPEND
jgi:hypothetical protein